ncbi:MAG: nucleotide exchange factor GrpE [Vulcanimicrobiota bacterium]
MKNQTQQKGDRQEIPVKIKEQKNTQAETSPKNQAEETKTKDETIAELQEQVKRLSAEFINFRKRQEKQYQESVRNAKENILKEFLPVLDSINQACTLFDLEKDEDPHTRGIKMIKKQLENTLEKLGVEPIEACGKPFDPEFHHAMLMEENNEHPDETVLDEFSKGYKFHDRVLRPTMVKVSRQK